MNEATVEEAIHQVIAEFEALSDCELYIAEDLDTAINKLIAAVEVRERERIRRAENVTFIGGIRAMKWQFNGEKWYIVPYSVLVPEE